MAKRGTPEHPKTLALADRMGWQPWMVVGLLECLWHWSSRYAITGIIAYPPAAIARGIHYMGDPDELIEALVETGWLDRLDDERLYIHDVADHADNTWRAALKRQGLAFAEPPKRRRVTTESLLCHDGITTESQRNHNGITTESLQRHDGITTESLQRHDCVVIQDGTLDHDGVDIQSGTQDFAYQTKPNQTKPNRTNARMRAREVSHKLIHNSGSPAAGDTLEYLREQLAAAREIGDDALIATLERRLRRESRQRRQSS